MIGDMLSDAVQKGYSPDDIKKKVVETLEPYLTIISILV